jgi:molybdenum ABC transporter ATP-binding protein
VSGLLEVSLARRMSDSFALEAELRADLAGGRVLVVFGPSGAGKTTLLRCIAGLERAERGRVAFGGEDWFDGWRGVSVPVQRRRVGYVTQAGTLFPHLTVRQNVAFGAGRDGRAAIDHAMALARVGDLADRYPGHLSGGQAQRVALARAVAARPRLLLLDEPLSSLDAAARQGLRSELRGLVREAGVPAVLVTHDRDEALAIGDQVAVVVEGRVRQTGRLEEVFNRPADAAVAGAVGVESVVPGTVMETADGLSVIRAGPAQLVAVNESGVSGEVLVCIRAADVTLSRAEGATSARNRLAGRVVAVRPGSPLAHVTVDCGFTLAALVTREACTELGLTPGAAVVASVKAPNVHLVPRG